MRGMSKCDQLRWPVVVLDWNLLRSMATSHDIPQGYSCVVPDHVFHEIATTKSGDPDNPIRKFGNWAARNVSRLWYGRTKEDLITRQWKRRCHSLSIQDVVHPARTRALRKFAIDARYDWSHFLDTAQSGDSIVYPDKEINEHVEVCKQIAHAWHKTYLSRSLQSIDEQAEWVRGALLVKPFVTHLLHSRWRPEWTSTLERYPNRFAVVRWARFVGWYCMRRILGETAGFENNFDDATYGLLASHTGHLGTNDRGLQRTALAIFPGLRILNQTRLFEVPS